MIVKKTQAPNSPMRVPNSEVVEVDWNCDCGFDELDQTQDQAAHHISSEQNAGGLGLTAC